VETNENEEVVAVVTPVPEEQPPTLGVRIAEKLESVERVG